jgi:hypothetical protein
LSGLGRPGRRLLLGLSALLAGPLLTRIAALLARPLLGLRLPALLALPLLTLAHRFLLPNRSSYSNGLVQTGRMRRLYGQIVGRPAAFCWRFRHDSVKAV